MRIEKGETAYHILNPVKSNPRTDRIYLGDITPSDIIQYCKDVPDGECVAIDFETTGTDWTRPDFRVVGMGLSCSIGSIYIDMDNAYDQQRMLFMVTELPLIAHNLNFDAGVMTALGYPMSQVNWQYCTYGLYMQLANEGHPGQKWGLKRAQLDVLGWEETNEDELDSWLINSGWIKGAGARTEGMTETELCECLNKIVHRVRAGKQVNPDKSQMWRAPKEILGWYCALDADSTWQLWDQVLRPRLGYVPSQLKSYHQDAFISLVACLIDMQRTGVMLDRVGLEAHNEFLLYQEIHYETEFLVIPEVAKYVSIYNQEKLDEYLRTEPTKYLKGKARGEEPPKYVRRKPLGEEPNKFTKTGDISKNWARWDERRSQIENSPEVISQNWLRWHERSKLEPQVSKNWTKWQAKLGKIKAGSDPELNKKYRFNSASGAQLRALLYHLYPATVAREHGGESDCGVIKFDHNGVELTMTKSGEFPTDKNALQQMGEPGKILNQLAAVRKEQGYVGAALTRLTDSNLLHLQTKCPGTVTGRLAGGGGLNYQQLPKTRGYLQNWIARPGYTMIDADWAALEPHCLAELSRDATMLAIYGPDAVPGNDIYLFVGAQLGSFGQPLLDAGYDPYNPDPELVSRLKKEFKQLRQIFKVLHLSSSYGAGPGKICQTLKLAGVDITYGEVQELHAHYWELFSGIKKFERELLQEYRELGGWVLNGIGRPICVSDRYIKDIVNRVIQSTGHDIHMMLLAKLRRELAGLDYHWIIPDFHDELTLEVRDDQVELVLDKIRYCVRQLNLELDGLIPLRLEGEVIESLADAKLED